MSDADDITQLFRQIGGQTHDYRDFTTARTPLPTIQSAVSGILAPTLVGGALQPGAAAAEQRPLTSAATVRAPLPLTELFSRLSGAA
jgi:hypothetical protein